jgi:hypothetical protein
LPAFSTHSALAETTSGTKANLSVYLWSEFQYKFFDVDEETLAKSDIDQKSGHILKPGIQKLAQESKLAGKDELWSSTHFHRQLRAVSLATRYFICNDSTALPDGPQC